MSDEQPEDTVARTYEYVADNLAHLYVLAAASAVLGALVQSQFGYVGVIVMVVVGALVSLAMSWFLYRKAERMNGDIAESVECPECHGYCCLPIRLGSDGLFGGGGQCPSCLGTGRLSCPFPVDAPDQPTIGSATSRVESPPPMSHPRKL